MKSERISREGKPYCKDKIICNIFNKTLKSGLKNIYKLSESLERAANIIIKGEYDNDPKIKL